ncbi:CsiV family protein [Hydrocarboniphaga sp.]|uniref:CsiV family protein n=1 Tax=Hydrocarboniphaga sp. TaxID=2033016 RepID=UPI00261F5998|nr:CsiV family protein [Hydrocarboniphaga sp.]
MPQPAGLALLLMLLLSVSAPARAETYRMDVILFVDLWASGSEAGSAPEASNLKGAIDIDDVAALRAAGIEILPEDQFGLMDQYNHLRYSKQFKPLLRLAWTQKDPPQERGPGIHIRIGGSAADGTPPLVDGSIAMLLSRYLHLDADLRYQQDGQSWSLDERRKMRRDEVHHLDSAKLGILANVSKVGGGAEDATP